MRQASYYIRGSGTDKSIALVKIWVDDSMAEITRVHLALDEAREQGCLPDSAPPGTQVGNALVVREVVEQHPSFYNRKISEAEALAMRNDPEVISLIR